MDEEGRESVTQDATGRGNHYWLTQGNSNTPITPATGQAHLTSKGNLIGQQCEYNHSPQHKLSTKDKEPKK